MKKAAKNTKLQLALQLDDFLPTKTYLKLFVDDKPIKIYHSTNSSKILRRIKVNNFPKGVLKMCYGYRETKDGKMEEFDNETVPLSKDELEKAYYAFLGE